MILEMLKKALEVVAGTKTVLAVAGIAIAVAVPGAFHDIPSTAVVATVTHLVTVTPTLTPLTLNLSIVIKCFGKVSSQCSSDVVRLEFPGLTDPDVDAPKENKDNLKVTKLTSDTQGRTVYELKILRPSKGGDTIIINVGINGRVVPADFKMKTIKGLDLLVTRFKCRDEPVTDPDVSRLNCSEQPSWLDRFALLLPGP